MKYYLLENNGKLEIIKVQPHQEPAFLEEYAGRIKAEADSLGELLQQLGKLQL
ncbi:MAG: hypothetical protein K0B37_07910 [Bacteroidales bacterium]|nr:hypothetical protein [Bacteroidales bacterium]MBW6479339.1 hypothetical protein [Bacteroidales bacterium]